DFRGRAVRQNGFPPWTGIAAHQSFDVDGGLRNEPDERIVPRLVSVPTRHAQRLPRRGLVATWNRRHEDFAQLRTERTHLVEVALDGRGVTVGLDQRIERLHQVPG